MTINPTQALTGAFSSVEPITADDYPSLESEESNTNIDPASNSWFFTIPTVVQNQEINKKAESVNKKADEAVNENANSAISGDNRWNQLLLGALYPQE